ncbi:MAG: hypothetical protein ACPGN3_14315 [Opitutales bacterium]
MSCAHWHRFIGLPALALGLLLSLGCSERTAEPSRGGELGSADEEDPREVFELADLQPLGTILTPDARERVATVLTDLWIERLPENIEIVTRTPDGVFSGVLGEQLLQRRRVRTFTIESGNPIAGDLVFYREVEPLEEE